MTTQESELERKRGRNWPALLIGFIVLAGATILLILSLDQGADRSEAPAANTSETSAQIVFPESGPPLQVGDRPYDFSLANADGDEIKLSELAGQPIIVNYWATWCGPCRIEMPHLQNTLVERQDDNLAILALDQDETWPEINSFFEEFGLTIIPLLDEDKVTSENYGVGRILPTSFFINSEGEITAIHRGPMTQSQIDGYLEETIPST